MRCWRVVGSPSIVHHLHIKKLQISGCLNVQTYQNRSWVDVKSVFYRQKLEDTWWCPVRHLNRRSCEASGCHRLSMSKRINRAYISFTSSRLAKNITLGTLANRPPSPWSESQYKMLWFICAWIRMDWRNLHTRKIEFFLPAGEKLSKRPISVVWDEEVLKIQVQQNRLSQDLPSSTLPASTHETPVLASPVQEKSI